MANSKREKMNRANRAKQFMPFDALKGFREALAEVEQIYQAEKELSEEQQDNINQKLKHIEKNDKISVEFYQNMKYLRISGLVSKIDEINRILVVDNQIIHMDSISALNKNEECL